MSEGTTHLLIVLLCRAVAGPLQVHTSSKGTCASIQENDPMSVPMRAVTNPLLVPVTSRHIL